MLRPAQSALFRRRVGIQRDPQLAVNFAAERWRHLQLRAVFQLQPVGHQHPHLIRQHLIELLQAGQNSEVQHHQVGRHQADKQQSDDQQQRTGKGAAGREADSPHALLPSGTKT